MILLGKYLKHILSTMSLHFSPRLFSARSGLFAAIGLAIGLGLIVGVPRAFADQFDDQISGLQNEIDAFQRQATDLRARGDTLQNALNAITAEKNTLQAQIDLNQAKYDKLTTDIEANEQKLARQKRTLNKTVVQIYTNSDTSPIVMLASTTSVSEYVAAQEARGSVRDQMKTAMDQVRKIKAELASQQAEVKQVLADQAKQRESLVAKESEQARLVEQTRGEEAAYQNMIAGKNSEIANLRAQQAASMARMGAGEGIVYGSSSYPWPNASMAYNDYCYYADGSSSADPWGYCKRQCVSYVAWKLNTDGRGNRGYSNLGNASGWGYGGSGIAWSDVQPGDVIVWYIGYYGHVMYVEWVDGSQIGISQMNVPYDSGAFSTKTYSRATLQSGAFEARRFH